MKYYRVDKVGTEIRNQTVFDDTQFIEKLYNKNGVTYYLMVSDCGLGKHQTSYRLRKDLAEMYVDSGRYQRDTKRE